MCESLVMFLNVTCCTNCAVNVTLPAFIHSYFCHMMCNRVQCLHVSYTWATVLLCVFVCLYVFSSCAAVLNFWGDLSAFRLSLLNFRIRPPHIVRARRMTFSGCLSTWTAGPGYSHESDISRTLGSVQNMHKWNSPKENVCFDKAVTWIYEQSSFQKWTTVKLSKTKVSDLISTQSD